MCGDTHCHSCGPAQGNGYCPYCGAWDDDGGCKNPAECEAKANEDAAGQEREYLEEAILESIAQEEGQPFWDVSQEVRQEIISLPITELRERANALKGN